MYFPEFRRPILFKFNPILWSAGVFLLLIAGCSPDYSEAKEKLHPLLSSDLKFVVEEVKNKSQDSLLLKRPFYFIEDYREFHGDSSGKYLAYVEAHFYYLERPKLHQVRKYRFAKNGRFWDRYEVVLQHTYSAPKRDSVYYLKHP